MLHQPAVSNSSTVKWHNLRMILMMLLRHPSVSRARLAELTGLSTTTISNLITELMEYGLVAEDGTETVPARRGAGRPRTALRLVPEARYAIGVHIGVGRVQIAITDLRAKVLYRETLTHPLERPAQAVLTEVINKIQDMIKQARLNRQQIVGVGIGASGLVNPNTGVNILAPNLDWHNIAIQETIETKLSLPVRVDNNVRAMALGEAFFGAAQGVRGLAFVYSRVGVGAGIVVNDQLFRGSEAGAGEIGHSIILAEGGAPCRCGNHGCLETLVSESAIIRAATEAMASNPKRANYPLTLEQIFEDARAGVTEIQAVLDNISRYMGIALANLVNMLNPELIILGGVFAQGADVLLPKTEETMRQRSFGNLGSKVKLQPTSFGDQAGIIGASALALTSLFYQQTSLDATLEVSL